MRMAVTFLANNNAMKRGTKMLRHICSIVIEYQNLVSCNVVPGPPNQEMALNTMVSPNSKQIFRYMFKSLGLRQNVQKNSLLVVKIMVSGFSIPLNQSRYMESYRNQRL